MVLVLPTNSRVTSGGRRKRRKVEREPAATVVDRSIETGATGVPPRFSTRSVKTFFEPLTGVTPIVTLRPLRLLVVWRRRRLLLADRPPDLVRDHLVRCKKREREVVVLAQTGVVEHARRIIAALLAAFDGVVIALRANRQDAFVPRRRRRRSRLRLRSSAAQTMAA